MNYLNILTAAQIKIMIAAEIKMKTWGGKRHGSGRPRKIPHIESGWCYCRDCRLKRREAEKPPAPPVRYRADKPAGTAGESITVKPKNQVFGRVDREDIHKEFEPGDSGGT